MLLEQPLYTDTMRNADSRQRASIINGIWKGLEADLDSDEGRQWLRDARKMKRVGKTYGLELLVGKTIKGFCFKTPALVLNDSDFPMLFVTSPEISLDHAEVDVSEAQDVLERHMWVKILTKASPAQRSAIKNKVIESVEYFKAKWRQTEDNPPRWDLVKKSKKSEQLSKFLRSNSKLKFEGFIPNIVYLKEYGNSDQLESDWVHAFSSPTLLYSHKALPLFIIAGPDIMFNDSIIRAISENKYKEPVFGVTG